MGSDAAPPLSIVIGSREGWDGHLRQCLDALREQAQRVGAEVVVVDGSGRPAPPPESLWPGVRWISVRERNLYRLRAIAYRAARGEVITATEDHCTVAPDWCDRILAAHRAAPEALAVGGVVTNATDDSALDRASFLIAHGGATPPIRSGPAERIAAQANVSYKRRALPPETELAEMELSELLLNEHLRDAAALLWADGSIRVAHHQSIGFRRTSLNHFLNGRVVGAFRRAAAGRTPWRRAALAGALPLYRSLRVLRLARSKRIGVTSPAPIIPAIVWLEYCHAAGELLGHLTGAGDAPQRVR